MTWLERLEGELEERGVPRRRRRQIALELEDHVRCDPEAEARLGDPGELAQTFADDLAASMSRRSAAGSFVLLVPVGAAFSACLLAATTFRGPDIAAAESLVLGLAAALGMVLAPQVALAAGLLALLGWSRTRSVPELPAGEAALLCRRASTALVAGAGALVALGLYAFEFRAVLPPWWTVTTLVLSLCLTGPVLVAAAAVQRVSAIRSTVVGERGDVFDDLHIPSHRHPWLLCGTVAAAAALCVALAGGPDEGVRNAVLEFVAATGGFVVLGRRLGLRA